MAMSQSSHGDIDIAALWRAIWRRKFLLLGLTLGAALLAFFGLGLIRPLYTSEVRVLIEDQESAYTRPTGATLRELVNPDDEAVASQVEVVMSRDLAAKTAEKLDLVKDAEFNRVLAAPFWQRALAKIGIGRDPYAVPEQERVLNAFEQRLSVYKVQNSRVIAIGFTSHQPKLAAEVANTLADEYLEWQQQHKLGQTKDASQWLAGQIDDLRKKVAESEATAERFRSKSGLFSGSNNIPLNEQQLSELNSQLILAKAQRAEAEVRARLIRQMLKEKGDVDATPEVLKAELIGRLIEQRVQVQRQLAELSATLMPSHPRVKQLQSELAGVRRQIRDEAGKIVQGLENEAQIAGARETSLRNSLNEVKTQTSDSGEDEIKLRALEREAKANRDLLEAYLARYNDASTRQVASAVPTTATIISRAHVSNIPSFPKKGPIAALVAAATLTLSLAFILAQELLRGAPVPVARPALPAPGTILGRASEAATALSASGNGSAAPLAETTTPPRSVPLLKSVDAVVSHVESRARGGVPHRLLVTGIGGLDAAPDALSLSRALARKDRRVMLLDVSRGASSISDALRVPRSPGYVELATDRASFEEVIRVDPESTLQVIAAGSPRGALPEDPKAALRRVLMALAEAYDSIVVHADLATARELSGVLFEGGLMSVAVARANTPVSAEQLGPFAESDVRLVVLERAIMDRPPPSRRLRGLRRVAAGLV